MNEFLFLDAAIGLLYITLSLAGPWFSHSLGTTLMKLTFFFCGLGHLVMVFPVIGFMHFWIDATAVSVGIPLVYWLVSKKEKIVLRERIQEGE